MTQLPYSAEVQPQRKYTRKTIKMVFLKSFIIDIMASFLVTSELSFRTIHLYNYVIVQPHVWGWRLNHRWATKRYENLPSGKARCPPNTENACLTKPDRERKLRVMHAPKHTVLLFAYMDNFCFLGCNQINLAIIVLQGAESVVSPWLWKCQL